MINIREIKSASFKTDREAAIEKQKGFIENVEMIHEKLNVVKKFFESIDKNMILNCAFRTKSHEISQGRSGRSRHVWVHGTPCAVDISHMNLTKLETYTLIEQLVFMGACRISRYSTFIHVEFSQKPCIETQLFRNDSNGWMRCNKITDMWL